MKIAICGKGGCGKSTITALLARALRKRGRKVLVIDTDESNLCLHRLLGADLPEVLLEAMGGRKGAREHLHPTLPVPPDKAFFKNPMTIDDLPADCVTDADGVKLLVVGKIRQYGEGCACMIGSVTKAVLSNLREERDDMVLIDAEAGLEHFGRRVDAGCDMVISVVDPTYESVRMAERAATLAAEAGIPSSFILNKVNDQLAGILSGQLDSSRIIAAVPLDEELFTQSLHGHALTAHIPAIETICDRLEIIGSDPNARFRQTF